MILEITRICIDNAHFSAYTKAEVVSLASINMSIRIDSDLKAQAEEILSQLGMSMNGTINMFLQQIVRDRAVPLSLSLSTPETLYDDLMKARQAREAGFRGRSGREVLAEMDHIIDAIEAEANEKAV